MQEIETVKAQGSQLLARATEFQVSDDASLAAAGEELRGIKNVRKTLDALMDPTISAANSAHKAAVAMKKTVEEAFIKAEGIYKLKSSLFMQQRDLARQIEIREREDAERKRLEVEREAERKRLYAEGKRAEAAAVKAAPIVVQVAPLPEPEKVEGVSIRKSWDFKIVNPSLLPREYLTPDTDAIRTVVRGLGNRASIPGVEVFERSTVAVRS